MIALLLFMSIVADTLRLEIPSPPPFFFSSVAELVFVGLTSSIVGSVLSRVWPCSELSILSKNMSSVIQIRVA